MALLFLIIKIEIIKMLCYNKKSIQYCILVSNHEFEFKNHFWLLYTFINNELLGKNLRNYLKVHYLKNIGEALCGKIIFLIYRKNIV